MVQKAEERFAESGANNAKIEAKIWYYGHYVQHSNENAERQTRKWQQEKIEVAVQETLDWLGENQLADQGIYYSRSLWRARPEEPCTDYFAFHGPRSEVPTDIGNRAENVHDLVLVVRST